MAPLPHDSASRLEAGESKGLGEKSSSEHIYGDSSLRTSRTNHNRAPTERMPSAGRLLLTLLLSFLVTFGLATALSPGDWHRRPFQRGDVVREKVGGKEEDGVSFTSLLQAASPNSLHELLHKYFPERFKDGVWESDVSAVEAVRRVDASLAASIIQLARRADNGTTTEPTTTTPPPPDSTTTEPPPPTTTSPPDDGTSTSTPPTTTAPPPTTESTSSPPGQTTTTTTRGSSSTTTVPPSSSRTTTTPRPNTSPVTSIPTTGRPTFASSPSLKPVTSTFTSTMDNGGVVIVTTTSFVDPDPAVTGSSSPKPTPTLQNAAPARFSRAWGALCAVVVGVALLI
ncbi:hypothetical protein CONLIGDRAFT_345322 [Coniochaeta ligniaria NRRL 30616]|uniref:Uncharacterized protein n=1 Tax=Coniochaeta ligniaria NRRL 30616 TaxID=1408157 RepID=A0A1J7IQN9_9PEZI|nr:hypothetical protein CONLIGDRAFT_345322 [Coniochaeta ligniaria NRRL 30616]